MVDMFSNSTLLHMVEYPKCDTDLSLAPANGPRPDGPGLVEPGEDLGDAAVRHQELPADVAGSDAHDGQLHDPLPDDVREWPSVHEDSAELVNAGLPWEKVFNFISCLIIIHSCYLR